MRWLLLYLPMSPLLGVTLAVLVYTPLLYHPWLLGSAMLAAAVCSQLLFTYVLYAYNYRAAVQPLPVPEGRIESILRRLRVESEALGTLGFREIDRFLLPLLVPTPMLVLKHEQAPIYWFRSHLGRALITFFEGGVQLATGGSVDTTPTPPGQLLQCAPLPDDISVLSHHRESVAFLERQGRRSIEISVPEIREALMERRRAFGEHLRSHALWPIRIYLWMLTRRATRGMSIQEQAKNGWIHL